MSNNDIQCAYVSGFISPFNEHSTSTRYCHQWERLDHVIIDICIILKVMSFASGAGSAVGRCQEMYPGLSTVQRDWRKIPGRPTVCTADQKFLRVREMSLLWVVSRRDGSVHRWWTFLSAWRIFLMTAGSAGSACCTSSLQLCVVASYRNSRESSILYGVPLDIYLYRLFPGHNLVSTAD